MRITKLEITNFQGLRHAALDVSAPVLLVAGHNGAGKSSLLDAISHAFTGKPGRVAQKQHIGQLITEGAKKGEARVEWLDESGEVQACGVALPSGKGSPLADSPFLPFVLDASRFAALDAKDRRRVLFDLTGASASPAEVGKRLEAKGLDLALFEKVKPLLRSGFPAAVEQAKAYASEARGAWKAITGENYGSEKAVDWAPELLATVVTEDQVAEAGKNLQLLEDDLAEAQQALGASKQARQAADGRAQRIAKLRELVDLEPRRRNKLTTDEQNQDEWSEKVMAAELASSGSVPHQPLTCPHCQGAVDLQAGTLVVHQPPEQIADAEAARRLPEYREYLASAQRAVANSQRDLKESEDAAAQAAALEAETAQAPSAEAIANGEQAINELRQARDRQQAKVQSLQEAFNAAAQRQDVIKQAADFHAEVCAWSALADALSPTGIPAEILADAIGPVNELLQRLSGTAGWSPVQISADIDVTFGGRLYGLLSESERWRCDTTIALAIATISGLRLALLDRFDVLDVPARTQQAMKLFQSLAAGGEIDTLIVAGTLKEPMAKTPSWLQAAWIDSGQLAHQQQQAAA
ncbi:AAA family ATPase [Pseudomonas aeruginosa]|uniref:AAA family ATPase n=1 Tax=Pseudomonas aeruginosa TaxID=287 RepID=UPI00190C266A|nr:AAA family ATPase [Pseudomonas aeruginosa]MBK3752743.1 AAA family ATPase [Pseudomonas aeruginosa]MBK3762981.1 AAA family ATPase [Pseudomonas aeruginosa]MBK3769521.1 AAA family ATPase [Pseudomonas aeruginosa]MBK3789709.1 AAA family ATPase [Pseudomonas aeruginosa]MBK3885755.1 AAA family ATPase [Pseudomonas aeruginosa]